MARTLHSGMSSLAKPDHKEDSILGELPENHPFVLKKYPMHGQNQYPSEDFPQYAAFVESYMEHLTDLGIESLSDRGRA